MLSAVWLVPALPLAGFVVLLVLGRRLGDPLAGSLFTRYLLAFEFTSVLLVIAVVGAVVLARHSPSGGVRDSELS